MRKIVLSVLSVVLVCIMISSCGGSCKSSGTAESTPESTPLSTPTEAPETSAETPAESTSPEATEEKEPETTEEKVPETRPVITVHDHKFNEIWLNDENEHWHKCNFCAKTGSNAPHEMEKTAVFAEPTENAPGKYIYTCKTCHYSYIAEESN